jgi:cytochrome c-type biogenesis protein
MALATHGLALVAGVLSTLSPCVLPILPIVIGTAATQHRYGPVALAGGLALSFVTIGMFVATIGFAIGLDTGVFRMISAVMLIGIGLVLLSPYLQEKVAGAASPLANWADTRFGGASGQGLWGQAGVGLLLGAVWSPCVGPTLGAASVLASQGKDLTQVALTMLMFGIGAALPLLILGMLSREVMLKMRGKMMSAGSSAKMAMGAVLLLIGLFVLTDFDKVVEAKLVDVMPNWLMALTTKY